MAVPAVIPKILATQRQVKLLRKQFCKDLTDDEFETYIYVCRASGLDPLQKQIYAIKRNDRETGGQKMTIQTGIDGYRLIADRTQMYAGSDPPEYLENADDPEHPIRARVTVYKFVQGEKCSFTGEALWKEYVQKDRDGNPTIKWRDSGHNQLSKCAEAQALRKGFPTQTASINVDAEMDRLDSGGSGQESSAPKAILEKDKLYEAVLIAFQPGTKDKKPTGLTFQMDDKSQITITTWHQTWEKQPWPNFLQKRCQFSIEEVPNKKGGEPYRNLGHFALVPENAQEGTQEPPQDTNGEPASTPGQQGELLGAGQGGPSEDWYMGALKCQRTMDDLEDCYSSIKKDTKNWPDEAQKRLHLEYTETKKRLTTAKPAGKRG